MFDEPAGAAYVNGDRNRKSVIEHIALNIVEDRQDHDEAASCCLSYGKSWFEPTKEGSRIFRIIIICGA